MQVIQDYDIDREWEGWGDSPLERDRLFKLIRELRVPGVIFVSGDMHFAELTRHPDDAAALGYPTYDLTPSGLDQVETAPVGELVNPNRIGELLNNFQKHGLVEIDWGAADPEVHLEIYEGPRLFLDHVVRLSVLQARSLDGRRLNDRTVDEHSPDGISLSHEFRTRLRRVHGRPADHEHGRADGPGDPHRRPVLLPEPDRRGDQASSRARRRSRRAGRDRGRLRYSRR